MLTRRLSMPFFFGLGLFGIITSTHAQHSVGTSANRERSVNAREQVVPGSNSPAPAPSGAVVLPRQSTALAAPIGGIGRDAEMMIGHALAMAIEGSALGIIANDARPVGAPAEPTPATPAAIANPTGQLRMHAEKALQESRRLLNTVGQPGHVQDAGAPRMPAIDRFAEATRRYVDTLAALQIPPNVPGETNPGREVAPIVLASADRAAITLVNHAVHEVLDAHKIRQNVAMLGSPSPVTDLLLSHASSMKREGRDALMRMLSSATLPSDPARATPAPSTIPAPGSLPSDSNLSPNPRAGAPGRLGGADEPDPLATPRPATPVNPAMAAAPTPQRLARLGIELMDALEGLEGGPAMNPAETRLPSGPASRDRNVPAAIPPR